ncbi:MULTISPECIES: hypothetical protein [unclassified Pseudomonas]|uniref:hypothetical protein n=1 Tax=unclassified Pseudomonas TaxID=196821 RepID=UPI000C2FD098|nr:MULTISPECIES: hypothetical protein [unclassified Pseudomonas]MCU1739865.1 hypothetical protein [Pseudomonas sp. 20S_6.2_Bac1]
MICIACGTEKEALANSHMIPNFIRKRRTGEVRADGSKKYSFKWIDRKDLPKQDLPKPNLMCEKCDNDLGARVENGIAALLMPNCVDVHEEWEKLPIFPHEINDVFDEPLTLGVYDYPLNELWKLEKFALSVAWRALHDLSENGEACSSAFLGSARGSNINKTVVRHLFHNDELPNPYYTLQTTYDASIYYWSPNTVALITNKVDEMPFAWTEVTEDDEFLGVAVMFAYWVIVWPLFEHDSSQYYAKLKRLNKLCFWDWWGHVHKQLNS